MLQCLHLHHLSNDRCQALSGYHVETLARVVVGWIRLFIFEVDGE